MTTRPSCRRYGKRARSSTAKVATPRNGLVRAVVHKLKLLGVRLWYSQDSLRPSPPLVTTYRVIRPPSAPSFQISIMSHRETIAEVRCFLCHGIHLLITPRFHCQRTSRIDACSEYMNSTADNSRNEHVNFIVVHITTSQARPDLVG